MILFGNTPFSFIHHSSSGKTDNGIKDDRSSCRLSAHKKPCLAKPSRCDNDNDDLSCELTVRRALTCRKGHSARTLLYSIVTFVLSSRCNHPKYCAASLPMGTCLARNFHVTNDEMFIRSGALDAVWPMREDKELPDTSCNMYPTCEP